MILAIAIRHAPDVAHEVDCTLDVTQSFARRQVDHPADEGAIDTRRIVGRMHVILVAQVRERRCSIRFRVLRSGLVPHGTVHSQTLLEESNRAKQQPSDAPRQPTFLSPRFQILLLGRATLKATSMVGAFRVSEALVPELARRGTSACCLLAVVHTAAKRGRRALTMVLESRGEGLQHAIAHLEILDFEPTADCVAASAVSADVQPRVARVLERPTFCTLVDLSLEYGILQLRSVEIEVPPKGPVPNRSGRRRCALGLKLQSQTTHPTSRSLCPNRCRNRRRH